MLANSAALKAALMLLPLVLRTTSSIRPTMASFGYLSISNLRLPLMATLRPPLSFRPARFSIDFRIAVHSNKIILYTLIKSFLRLESDLKHPRLGGGQGRAWLTGVMMMGVVVSAACCCF